MKRLFSIFSVFLILLPFVLAITGEIGNARAIIKREWAGRETLERTILVRNSNDVKLNIKLEPSEEIKDIVDIIDKEFELQAGEEKNARYNLKIMEEGAWSGRINVFFRPEEGNSVVLSSTIILLVGDIESEEVPDEVSEETNETTDDVISDDVKEGDDIDGGDVDFGIRGVKEDKSNIGIIFLVVLVVILVVAAIVGIIFILKK